MPISFIVRDAVNDDAAALTAIHNAQGVATTASYALTPGTVPDRRAWLARQHAARHPVLVAADGQGRIVGFADYDRFRSLPGYDLTVEHSVYTAPGHERLGIGAALMDQLIDRARSAGMHAMVGVIDAETRQLIAALLVAFVADDNSAATTAVTAAPVSTPASGWAVSRARACRRVSPAACCKASVRVSILYKKSAAPPNNCRIIHKRCSMPDAPFALCVCGTQTFVNFCETIPAGGCNPACKSLLLSSVNS